jgi:hypothetical protein
MTRYTCNNHHASNGCGRIHVDEASALSCCKRSKAARVPIRDVERTDVEDDDYGMHRSWLYQPWMSDPKRVPVTGAHRLFFVDAYPPVSCSQPMLRDWTLLQALGRSTLRTRLREVQRDITQRIDRGSISGVRAKAKARVWCELIDACLDKDVEFWLQRWRSLSHSYTQQDMAAIQLVDMCGAQPENRKSIPAAYGCWPDGYSEALHGSRTVEGTYDYNALHKRWVDTYATWKRCAQAGIRLGEDKGAPKPDPTPDPQPDEVPGPVAPTPAPASPAVGDVAQQIAQLLTSGGAANPDEVRAIAEQAARDAIAAAASDGTLTMRVQVTRPDMSEWEIPEDEALHDKFQDCVGWLRLGVPVFLRGPAGTGKSMLGRQLAAAFDRPFASMSLSGGTAEYHFTGSRLPDADGSFRHRTTPFLDLFENGGVMLLDEVDACDENVLLAINDGIANGLLPVPGRDDAPFAHKHEDFMLVCAANTWGTGPSAVYVGRNQLDGAFLNRFGLVEVDYDPKLERALCPNMPELVTKWQRLRDEVRKAQLRRIISMRELQRLYLRTQADGWTVARCLQEAVLAWTPDEIKSCRTVAEVAS